MDIGRWEPINNLSTSHGSAVFYTTLFGTVFSDPTVEQLHKSSWNDFPRGGSSGGPWFNVGGAAGIHKDSLTDDGIYYCLDRAKMAFPNLFLYCGQTSEYLCSWP